MQKIIYLIYQFNRLREKNVNLNNFNLCFKLGREYFRNMKNKVYFKLIVRIILNMNYIEYELF